MGPSGNGLSRSVTGRSTAVGATATEAARVSGVLWAGSATSCAVAEAAQTRIGAGTIPRASICGPGRSTIPKGHVGANAATTMTAMQAMCHGRCGSGKPSMGTESMSTSIAGPTRTPTEAGRPVTRSGATLAAPAQAPHSTPTSTRMRNGTGPEGSCDFSDRFRVPENTKPRKRRHDSLEDSDSHGEKPAWRNTPKGPLEEPKVKKHKKSKKKKKSKDKHRTRDSRHPPDSDLSGTYSDADLHRHKKKKKKKKRHSRRSEDLGHFPQASGPESADLFRRTDGGVPPADGLALDRTKPFRMGSRADRCPLSECGQGD